MKFRIQVRTPTGMMVADEQEVEQSDVAEIVQNYMDDEMGQVEMQLLITCTDDED